MWLLKFNFFAVTIWPLYIYLTMRKQQLLLNVSRLFYYILQLFYLNCIFFYFGSSWSCCTITEKMQQHVILTLSQWTAQE